MTKNIFDLDNLVESTATLDCECAATGQPILFDQDCWLDESTDEVYSVNFVDACRRFLAVSQKDYEVIECVYPCDDPFGNLIQEGGLGYWGSKFDVMYPIQKEWADKFREINDPKN